MSSQLDGVATCPHSYTELPHVLTAGQSGLMSSHLDGVITRPHIWMGWPHVLTAGQSGLMSSQLDRVAWLLCWAHQGTEAVEEGGGSNALVLLVIQLWCSRDYDLGGRCTSALEEPLFPKDLGGHPGGGSSRPDCPLMQQQQGGFLQPVRLPEQT